jgi:hypothetical protein
MIARAHTAKQPPGAPGVGGIVGDGVAVAGSVGEAVAVRVGLAVAVAVGG